MTPSGIAIRAVKRCGGHEFEPPARPRPRLPPHPRPPPPLLRARNRPTAPFSRSLISRATPNGPTDAPLSMGLVGSTASLPYRRPTARGRARNYPSTRAGPAHMRTRTRPRARASSPTPGQMLGTSTTAPAATATSTVAWARAGTLPQSATWPRTSKAAAGELPFGPRGCWVGVGVTPAEALRDGAARGSHERNRRASLWPPRPPAAPRPHPVPPLTPQPPRKCKEVRCRKGNFADGYGQWLDRSRCAFVMGAFGGGGAWGAPGVLQRLRPALSSGARDPAQAATPTPPPRPEKHTCEMCTRPLTPPNPTLSPPASASTTTHPSWSWSRVRRRLGEGSGVRGQGSGVRVGG